MHVAILHRDNRPWPPPPNHLDGRVCPDCGTTAHGHKAQRKHREWHLQLNTLLTEVAKRCGLAETPFEVPWRWGAEVEGQSGELEEAAE